MEEVLNQRVIRFDGIFPLDVVQTPKRLLSAVLDSGLLTVGSWT